MIAAVHIDLTHVDALTLFFVALACIPAVQFATESLKQTLQKRMITLSPIVVQTMSCGCGIVATEIAAVVKMAVDIPTALMAGVLGIGVGFAASGHRDYLVAAYKVVLSLTHSTATIPPELFAAPVDPAPPDPPPAA